MATEKRSTAGYSGTPLCKKLGIGDHSRVKYKNIPDNYTQLLHPVPKSAVLSSRLKKDIDVWHLFTSSRSELKETLKRAQTEIRQNGAIWVSWPKKSSGLQSEVTEDTIREVALPMGLVDIKVCAVDRIWSGLKLVIRKERRT